MINILNEMANVIWSMPLIILILLVGLYFSLRMGFPQILYVREMFRLLKEKGAAEEGLSPFQSFVFTAARTIGVGNIAGMATGIYFGGPGAIFWLWVLAILGSSVAIIEGTLAQTYKEIINHEFKGGPANYMQHGMKNKTLGKGLAVLYSFITFVSLTFLMPGVQSFYIVQGLHGAFGIRKLLLGILVTFFLGVVIFGGIKRMGQAAQRISPVIGSVYVLMSIVVIVWNITDLPAVLALIFRSAFGKDAVFGAIFGSALQWGIRRGVHANEVGIGTSAITSATGTVKHPVQQGLLSGLSVYIGTLFVCTTTTLMILMTNSYHVVNEKTGTLIYEGTKGLEYENPFISNAIQKTISIPNLGNIFVALAILFFAFIALTAFYLYAESNLVYLIGDRRIGFVLLKVGFLVSVLTGTLVASDTIWAMADIGNGLMAWINIIALLPVGSTGIKIYQDYRSQKNAGIEVPIFNPGQLHLEGISEAWEKE